MRGPTIKTDGKCLNPSYFLLKPTNAELYYKSIYLFFGHPITDYQGPRGGVEV
jgi:hypothetical protein